MAPRVKIDRGQLEELCRRYRVRRLSLFGSVTRDDFGEASDVDILVEFQSGVRVGLSFFSLQDELSALLGRSVDLNTPGFLSPHIRDRIIRGARPLYEAA